MEALDHFSTLVIVLAAAVALAGIFRFLYNIIIDKPVTIINIRTGKSASITRKYNKAQMKRLIEVLR